MADSLEMQSKEQEALPRVAAKLWRRAPAWRFSVIAALTCAALSVVFLPPHTTNSVATNTTTTISSNATGVTTSPDQIGALIQNQPATPAQQAVLPQPGEKAPTTARADVNANSDNGQRVNNVPTEQSCQVNSQFFPPVQHYSGKVVAFMSRPEALALLQRTQEQLGMLISPNYVANQRVLVGPVAGRAQRLTTVLVPQGMLIKPGDVVTYSTGRRDLENPCRYIPNLIDRVITTGIPATTSEQR